MDVTQDQITVDVAVIGGGGAGLRAACEAASAGANTLLITKGRLGVSGATAVGLASTAGFAVPNGAGDPTDNPRVHFDDIMTAAQGCADPNLVKVLTEEAVEACADMERLGVEFIQDQATGEPLVAQGDFASKPRNRKIYHHGKPIVEALTRELTKVGGKSLEHASVLDLLRHEDGSVAGLIVLTRNGKVITVHAGAVVLTTGGAGQLFDYSLMPTDITGDGYALAYRAGARLANMEFMQSGFGTIKPAQNIIMSWFWGLLPAFTDNNGRPVLEGRLPSGMSPETVMSTKIQHYPFSSSDASKWLEISAVKATLGDPENKDRGLWLDMRNVDPSRLTAKGFSQLWELSKKWLLTKKMDVTKERLRIGVFGHAINGGVVIDEHGQSNIEGLLACGENATGPYGADRLGGNMLLNCQVFGKRAGLRAAELGRSRMERLRKSSGPHPEIDTLTARMTEREGKPIREALQAIKNTMSRNALVVRTEESLEAADRDLANLQGLMEDQAFGVTNARDVIRQYEIHNLIDVGRMMVQAARMRRETRGSHYREDAPALDPEWGQSILIERQAAEPKLFRASLGE